MMYYERRGRRTVVWDWVYSRQAVDYLARPDWRVVVVVVAPLVVFNLLIDSRFVFEWMPRTKWLLVIGLLAATIRCIRGLLRGVTFKATTAVLLMLFVVAGPTACNSWIAVTERASAAAGLARNVDADWETLAVFPEGRFREFVCTSGAVSGFKYEHQAARILERRHFLGLIGVERELETVSGRWTSCEVTKGGTQFVLHGTDEDGQPATKVVPISE